MRKIILTLLTSILTIAAYCQHQPAYIQNIGGEAILFFPAAPRVSNVDNGLAYEADRDNILYSASVETVKLGPFEVFYKNFRESFYRGVLIGFAKSIHGKILYKKDVVVDEIKGIEYEGKGAFDTTTYYIVYRSFYIDKKLVSYGIWFKEPVTQNDARVNAFFSTFKFIRKTEHNNSVWSNKTLVIKGVKYALIIILLIALIVGSIIFIVRRSSAKKLKNE